MEGSRAFVGVVVAICLGLGACGGSEFGGEIRLDVTQRHVRTETAPADAPLNFPADQPFAIHLKRSSQTPGPDGRARGESDATPDGGAFCLADAANGGSASAEFNLGHRIENRSSLAQAVSLTCDFDVEQVLDASDPPAPETIASVSLVLMVVDSRKHVVSRTQVAQAVSDSAAGKAASRDQRTVSLRFEAGETYDIMLFGKVDAATGSAQAATARLEVRGLRFRVAFSPLATAPTAN